jgi:hypothetical protein
MSLSFTDGTTTVNLNDGPGANTCAIKVNGYAPRAAMADDATVSDSAEVEFHGISTGRARINQINAIFARARQREATGLGPRCFVQFKYDNSDITHRSEIVDGRIEVDESTMGHAYAANEIPASITFIRMPYWEGALTQLPISNGNGSNNTSGLTVGNHGASQSCWFTVAGSDIAGDADAPVQVRLQITGTGVAYVLYGHLNGSNAYTSNSFYQGEGNSSGLSTGASATSSGSTYATVPANAGQVVNVASWVISGTTAGITNGKSVMPFLRFNVGPPQIYLQGVLAGSISEWMQTNTSKYYCVLPPLPLPAVPLDSGYASSAYTMALNTWNPSSNTSFQLDYITLLPTDGWRELIYGAGTDLTSSSSNTIYDDGIENQTYGMTSGTDKYGVFATSGRWPMITPGVGQSFVFQASAAAGTAAIGITFSAKLYYRPRRRSI